MLKYAGQSFRLLALAAGTLRHVTAERLASMSQQEAEAECDHMDLLALLVLSNSAHTSSRPAISSLQERYTHIAFTCAVAPCPYFDSCPGESSRHAHTTLLAALASFQGMRCAQAAAEVELLLHPAVNEGALHLNTAFCLLCSDRHVCQIGQNACSHCFVPCPLCGFGICRVALPCLSIRLTTLEQKQSPT